MNKIAQRTLNIPPFIVMDVLERAHELERQGRDIIHLEIGEPDFPTPQCVCQAAREAISRGETHYTHSLGLLELREAICAYYYEKYGVSVDPGRILVTSGTSPALFMVFSALLEAGEEVIMTDPHYPCYPNFVEFLGARPSRVKGYEEDGFQLRPEAVRKKMGPKTRGILINSPANPTGNLLSESRMAEIAQLGPPIISDEIYHGLVYGEKEHSILEFTDNAFVLNGFSKIFAMTGWRLGYLIAPPQFIRPMQKVQQNFFISAGSVSQWAGIAALKYAHDDVESMRAVYDERRKYMIKRIRDLGFGVAVEPAGAFYILANARHLCDSSYDLAFEILEKADVGVTPGIDFGKNAEGYIRFSYANSIENIREGLNRIERFLKTHGR
ncbi:putative aspartate transaminase [delta proteobacterium NaphS2]|nr:putative aspartate transaminase [delta proteobacterium NaphS2]